MKKILNNIKYNWQDFCDWVKDNSSLIRNYFIALFLVGSFLVVYFWPYLNSRVFISIRSGETGVLWQRFFGGTNLEYTYHEGFHIIMPWDQMFIYNVRLQQTPHHIIALCKNGLPVELEVSIRHRPSDRKLTLLHSVVGPNYVETVIKPEVEALVRTVVSQFEPNELYTSEGYIINLIVQGSMSKLSERYVSLDALLIKRISLPTKIADSIEAKLIEEQRLFEYEYRVKQAQKEAERKWYEAQGILEFQKTVASGGSFRDYLRYTGIQATVELSKSNNTKLVVMGGAESNGLPLILNLPSDENERKAADSLLNKSPNSLKQSGPSTVPPQPATNPAPTPPAPPSNIAPTNVAPAANNDGAPQAAKQGDNGPQNKSADSTPQSKSATP
ncbi:MAG: prohibitin family protein [Opitutaceae bacterium]